MGPIRAIFSDFGGVLYHTPDYRWLMYLGRLLGQKKDELLWGLYLSPTESDYVQAVLSGKIPEGEVWRSFAARLHLSPGMIQRIRASSYRPRRLNRAMIDFFQSLRPRYQTAILSNAASEFRATFCHAFGIEAWADDVIISAEVGLAKPDPQIYEVAAKRMGVEPHEALFFDDIAENVESARQTGMHAILFRNNRQAIAEIQRVLSLA